MMIESALASLSKHGGMSSEYSEIMLDYLGQLKNHEINVRGLLLYGSLVKGTSRLWQSDIDVIVLIKGPSFDSFERIVLKRQVTRDAYPGVQAVWFTVEELKSSYQGRAGHIMDALYEGWILFDPDSILGSLREQLHEELRARRFKREKNHWVWSLNYLGEEISL